MYTYIHVSILTHFSDVVSVSMSCYPYPGVQQIAYMNVLFIVVIFNYMGKPTIVVIAVFVVLFLYIYHIPNFTTMKLLDSDKHGSSPLDASPGDGSPIGSGIEFLASSEDEQSDSPSRPATPAEACIAILSSSPGETQLAFRIFYVLAIENRCFMFGNMLLHAGSLHL